MKKKSRFLTGLLSAVMALSLCALPAAAAADETNVATVQNTDVWGTNTASITIHKYEYNGKEATKPASGKELNDSDIPQGATPLKDVTFAIYKVQDKEALASYYSGVSKDNYTDFTSKDKYYKENSDGTFTVEDGTGKTVNPEQTNTTNGNGVARFDITNSALGLYLVVETNAPDKVTKTVEPFLVSVPMKNPSDQTTWLYDVHVYPKNGTSYGAVSIVKKGITGGDETGVLAGVAFTLEKKQSNNTWVKVTEPEDGTNTPFNLTTGSDGRISVSGLSQGTYHFKETGFTGSEGNKGYILSEEPIEFTIDDTGKVKYNGAYKKDDIVVENYRPDLDKKVENNKVNGDDKYVEGADYSVGDMVPYQITVKVPQNIGKLATFTVTDTPAGLEDQKDTIAIAVKDETGKTLTKDTEYKVEDTTPAGGFSIAFDTSKMKDYAGKTLVITYKAKLSNSAVKTTDGNKNSAMLTYTNKIKENGTPDDNFKNTITDETVVYTFAIRIKKTDGGKENLPGAKFDLYKEVTVGTQNAISGDDVKQFGLDSAKTWLKVESDLTSGRDGLVTTNKGLANGTYYLVETQAPADYNLLAKPVEVKLDIAYKYTWAESGTYDREGNLTKHAASAKGETFAHNADEADVIGTQKGTDVGATGTEAKGTEITIINRKGFELPVTGGFGTLLFSGIGVLLVVGGIGVLMSIKKKKGNV